LLIDGDVVMRGEYLGETRSGSEKLGVARRNWEWLGETGSGSENLGETGRISEGEGLL